MNEKIKIEKFLYLLEFFYRNYGSKWSVKDFLSKGYTQEFIKKNLIKLKEKKVIKFLDNIDEFEVIDLPSNHKDLLVYLMNN